MTTSSSLLANTLVGEEPIPVGPLVTNDEGGEADGRHEEITVTVLPMVIAPPTNKRILTNEAELERWDAYKKKLFSVLFLSTKDAVNRFIVCFAGTPGSTQQVGRQAVWKAMSDKYLIFLMQWQYILMRKLNGMVMLPNQDPNENLIEVFQQRNELEHIGESFLEVRILDLISKGPSEEYEPIRFAAKRDHEISLKETETTMRNMYANRVARGGGSTLSRREGRESTMTAFLGFKGSRNYCNKLGHKKPSASNLCESLAEDHYI